jgi:uncharacterized UPF0160 family protein
MLSIFSKKPVVVVHSGKFHPDDISAVAIISLYLGKSVKVVRSRDPKVWETADYMFDVGGEYDPTKNRFDHHQPSFTLKRENGISYSSAGLAWKHFGEKVAGSHEVWQKIEEKIIEPLDAEDNGIELYKNNFEGISPYTFADYLFAFNPTYFEKKQGSLKAFEKAIAEAKKMFKREIKKTKDNLRSQKIVEKIYQETSDKRLIILNDEYSWQNVLGKYPEPLFVVKPSFESGTWHAYAVRSIGNRFDSRLDFPESWGGMRDEELVKITGVADAVYCHKGRFIAVAKSKDGAIALAKLALNQKRQ